VSLIPVTAIVAGVLVAAVWARRQLASDDPMIDLRLFRIPAFRASLIVNFLTIFVAVGYFLFVAQYLQLVAVLSPLEAGAWSLPSALAFIVGSNAAPRLVTRVRISRLISAGLALAAVGLVLLSQAGVSGGLPFVVAASVVISLGLAPIFGLTTELIVGSAPPERAGAASGMSETFFELGAALGISILGSIGTAIYRGTVAVQLPAGVPAEAAVATRDTLGAAAGVARQLPDAIGAPLLEVARGAFVQGMQLAAVICVVMAVAVSIFALVALRDVGRTGAGTHGDARAPERDERSERVLAAAAD
jgi:DHA2 family multidrug resistance protein-like MFS transporter